MRIVNLAIAGSVLGILLAGIATADEKAAQDICQPLSVQQTAYENDDYDYYLSFAPQEKPSESPSDQPTAAADEPDDTAVCDAACGGSRGRCRRCCRCCCEPWTLPQPCFLARRGITLGGWTEVGISVVANNPADRFNGVVTFNDRDGEGQLNQQWFYLDRQVDTGGYGWGWGGHVDFVYGTDAYFTQCTDGLEANWDQEERFYQAALPQFYLDVAYNDLTIRIGHFFTIIGYEVVPAPENFFYSHAYAKQYGEPFTHTGILGFYDLSDQWRIIGGLQRGWNQFDDTDGHDSLGFLGGVNWTSASERFELAFAITATEQGVDVDRTMYSIVGTTHVTDYLTWVIQHDYGQNNAPRVGKEEWYGVNNYLFYELNDRWDVGLRFEWFRDDQGSRVTGIRPTNALAPNGVLPAGAFFPGDFYEVTLGLNWKPRQNIILRPEVRWDWYDAIGTVNPLPYDSGDRASQFMFGCDLIVTY